MLGALHANVIDEELPVPYADEVFGADGSLADPGLAGQFEELLAELVEAASPAPVLLAA